MDKIVALPGVKPQTSINEEAALMLDRAAASMRSGEIVGMALVTIRPNGNHKTSWDCPSNMGAFLYCGVSRLAYDMIATTVETT